MTDFILEFIQTHSEWAVFIVFVIAFFESLLIIGLFLPGWILLVGIGGMIGADILSFYPIVIAAYLGAVLGEYLSFYLGYHYHHQILHWPIVSSHQKLIDLSHNFFQKHGVGGVFIGRFFGPTRALVPFIAGISEMSKQTFFWVNCLSGLLWAPFYLVPGILIGAAYTLEKEQSDYLLLILIVIGIAFSLVVKFNKQFFKAEKKDKSLLLIKAVLSWMISISMVLIFTRSPLWELFSEILSVLWDKL